MLLIIQVDLQKVNAELIDLEKRSLQVPKSKIVLPKEDSLFILKKCFQNKNPKMLGVAGLLGLHIGSLLSVQPLNIVHILCLIYDKFPY